MCSSDLQALMFIMAALSFSIYLISQTLYFVWLSTFFFPPKDLCILLQPWTGYSYIYCSGCCCANDLPSCFLLYIPPPSANPTVQWHTPVCCQALGWGRVLTQVTSRNLSCWWGWRLGNPNALWNDLCLFFRFGFVCVCLPEVIFLLKNCF